MQLEIWVRFVYHLNHQLLQRKLFWMSITKSKGGQLMEVNRKEESEYDGY